jgi:hypothetical protein
MTENFVLTGCQPRAIAKLFARDSVTRLQVNTHQAERFLQCLITGVETLVNHVTPENKKVSITWRHTLSRNKEVKSNAVSNEGNNNPLLGPSMFPTCEFP